MVSLLPSKKGSATVATIVHLFSYYVVYTVNESYSKAVASSLVPNVALKYMLDHLLHVELSGGVGLTF